MPKLTVIAPCWYPDESPARRLKRTCDRFGLNLVLFGEKEPWHCVGSDTHAHFTVAPKVIEFLTTDLVLFTDASDTFVMAGEDEIVEKYQRLAPMDLLLSAEPGLYPPRLHPEFDAKCEPCPSPWRYPNGGGWMGTPSTLLQVLNYLRTHYEESPEAQYRWIKGYIDKLPITLDHTCSVFQTMSGGLGGNLEPRDGRLFNPITGEYPCVAHFNGKLGGIDETMEKLGL